MKIKRMIEVIRSQCSNYFNGEINLDTTRDQILYGNPNQEVTGITVTLFASVDVIRKSIELGNNFIIVHEALFWNHGDHTDWLEDNQTFLNKRALLDEGNICVWRLHDFIHAGIPIDGEFVDGIFYGVAKYLGWLQYPLYGLKTPMIFDIPKISVHDLMIHLMDNLDVKGMKTMGNLDCEVSRVMIAPHIIGPVDNQVTSIINKEHVECILAAEITDFTVAEYIRDAAMLGENRCILAVGHFNIEEPGMKFFASYLPTFIGKQFRINYVASGDSYTMVNRKDL